MGQPAALEVAVTQEGDSREHLPSAMARYRSVREATEALATPLSPEDQMVQSMPDVSPTKWHRAHVTWFFETFLLEGRLPGYRTVHPSYRYLFNSYYEAVGERQPRPERGLLSRPSCAEVTSYRALVDDAMQQLIASGLSREAAELLELGLHHEQQHQELLLMDIKHVLSKNPLLPAYGTLPAPGAAPPAPVSWLEHPGGLGEIGAEGPGFSFDNEQPRHRVYLEPFALADRPVSCGEWREFIDDAGYERPELWLAEGWAITRDERRRAPLYWLEEGASFSMFSLGGHRELDPAEPVCHVSYFEADAFARWSGARLPTEAEWEVIVTQRQLRGEPREVAELHPGSPPGAAAPGGIGEVWEWTCSSYLPYPGFRTAPGAVGEYNGKFMVNQQVLRGGCCATPPGHWRPSYRNFFPPSARWAFSGLRLAQDR